MHFLLTVLLSAAVVAAAWNVKLSDEQLFKQFKHTHGKVYADAAEEAVRFNAFQINMRTVEKMNAIEGDTVFGMSPFVDLTPAEFRATYLMPKSVLAAPRVDNARMAEIPAAMPKSFDWRDTPNVITPVKNQAQCGSCWAFSATENIESVWALQGNNTLTALSVQQIVSCDTVDQGCNGGDLPTAFTYVKKAGGLETEAEYPYVSGSGNAPKCKDDAKLNKATFDGYERVQHLNETAMAAYLAAKAPLAICVDAETWQSYVGGIVKRNCAAALDHCVMAVGYNQDGAVPYWIVRNSWGPTWGEKGYIYIQMFEDLCGIGKEAMSVFIK